MGGPLPARRTYRLPERLVASTLIAAWLFFVAWRGDEIDHLVMPVLAWGCLLLGWWPRVVADRTGVHVVRVRRRRLTWDEVASIDLVPGGWRAYGDVLTLTTTDGARLTCGAISPLRGGSGAAYCREVCDDLRRRQRLAARVSRAKARRSARAVTARERQRGGRQAPGGRRPARGS